MGPLHAELARDLTATLGGAQWRFAVTDEHGQLVHCGITSARPAGAPTRSAACRAIVELQVPATALRALAADPTTPADWAGVVADLTRQLDYHSPGQDRYHADADRRVPGAALRRYLEIRDRYCIMIGCRAPAHTADKDHTIDHTHHGPTLAPNLGDQWRAVVAILTDPGRRTSPSDARVRWLGSGLYRCAGCERPSLRVSTAGRGIPCYRCPGKLGTTGHVVRVSGPLDAYIENVIVERLSRPDAIELLVPVAPEVDLPGLRAAANAVRARLTDIAEMLGDGELTRVEAQIARVRASARLEQAEAEIATATRPSPLAGLVDVPDPAAVWAGLDIGRRRAVLDTLMTVTVLPSVRPGPRFDPGTVRVEWKEEQQ